MQIKLSQGQAEESGDAQTGYQRQRAKTWIKVTKQSLNQDSNMTTKGLE